MTIMSDKTDVEYTPRRVDLEPDPQPGFDVQKFWINGDEEAGVRMVDVERTGERITVSAGGENWHGDIERDQLFVGVTVDETLPGMTRILIQDTLYTAALLTEAAEALLKARDQLLAFTSVGEGQS